MTIPRMTETCPQCGYETNMVQNTDQEDAIQDPADPRMEPERSVMICMRCGLLSLIDRHGGRIAPDMEIALKLVQDPTILKTIMLLIAVNSSSAEWGE